MKPHQRKARRIALALFLGLTITGGAVAVSVDPTTKSTRMATVAGGLEAELQIDGMNLKTCGRSTGAYGCKRPGHDPKERFCYVTLCAAVQAGAYACTPYENGCEIEPTF